ncbi:permease prefix domain 1-containing protein [Brevibacillus daliensis]|uniref:permease prefix domain 1-containing protein n=1 Tax=Brevibacillus daliensis TaxID=2892995 RepID=UPI001E3F28E7|nr:permease prefix domain 1-containing protein [Brevibacillus daliensis]
MNKKIQGYVDQLFDGYQESQQLHELKEEIMANLLARIEESVANGKTEEEAFQLAIKELGDISEVAEEISLNKKYEVIDEMFNRKPLEKKFAFGYTVATGILLFGMIVSLGLYFQKGELFLAVSSLFPFAVVSISAFVFLGLVQETSHQYGMKPIRAIFYTLAAALLSGGVFISFIAYLEKMGLKGRIDSLQDILAFHNEPLFLALAVLMPFVLPAICLLIFLGLTEKDRTKPSVFTSYNSSHHTDTKEMMVYGNLSGAIWIFSVGIFIALGFLWTWKISWIVFIFAVGFQVLLEAYFSNKRKSHT